MSRTRAGQAVHLGRFIRQCRASHGYTSRELAALTRERREQGALSDRYIIDLEHGRHTPGLDKAITLAEVLDVPLSRLVDEFRRDLGSATAEAEPGAGPDELLEAAGECKASGEYRRAAGLYQAALRLQERDPAGGERACQVRLELARCYRLAKLHTLARDELAAVLRQRSLPAALRRQVHFNLAELHRESGDLELARTFAGRALELARAAGDRSLEANAVAALGSVRAESGDCARALQDYRTAEKLFVELGNRAHAAIVRLHAAMITIELRKYDRAADALRRSIKEFTALPDRHSLAHAEVALAKALFLGGDRAGAKTHATRARALAEKLELPQLLFVALYYLWRVATAGGRRVVAQVLHDRLRWLLPRVDAPVDEVDAFARWLESEEAGAKS